MTPSMTSGWLVVLELGSLQKISAEHFRGLDFFKLKISFWNSFIPSSDMCEQTYIYIYISIDIDIHL